MDRSLRRKLDRMTDVLWAGGITNPVTCIERISCLIYLKLLDEEEAACELKDRLGAGNGARLFPLQAERYPGRRPSRDAGEERHPGPERADESVAPRHAVVRR